MSTVFQDIRTALIARVTANLASIDPAWVANQHVAWPGTNFPAEGKNYFMAMDIAFEDVKQAALGSAVRRIDGAVFFTFFGQQGLGSAQVTKYLDALNDLFPLGLSLAVGTAFLRFLAPKPVPLQDGDHGLMLQALRCEFFIYA